MDTKTILITGSTDGLGLATAKMLASRGAQVVLHGRNAAKLAAARATIEEETGVDCPRGYVADLSRVSAVRQLAAQVREDYPHLSALINNAGVYQTNEPITVDGLDARLMVNMVAPYLLTKELMPCLSAGSRVVNISSAAQAPVERDALLGVKRLDSNLAYAESKLGLIMWTNAMAAQEHDGVVFVSVNPKSFLGTAMVRKAYGRQGSDVRVGADIVMRAALAPEFMTANGKYFDNDSVRFASPHPDALNESKCAALVALMNQLIANLS
ncbi:MAG: SDR family NAD(P)-dependent oxidoreductase [Akkermansia sp.]